MPWLLDELLADTQPDWTFDLDSCPSPTFRNHDFVPTVEQLKSPIRVIMRKLSNIGDYVSAPWKSRNVIVSEKFKEIIEELSPHQHVFFPVDLQSVDGAAVRGAYYLFKVGPLIDDAILLEESPDVVRHRRFDVYEAIALAPRITWRASKVKGRHVWADSRLPQCVVVSDEVMERIRAADLSGYVARECHINTDN